MFETHDPAQVEQLHRLAKWVEMRVAQAEAADPELSRLKQAERVAASKLSPSLPETEYSAAFQAHENAVWALLQHISSRSTLK